MRLELSDRALRRQRGSLRGVPSSVSRTPTTEHCGDQGAVTLEPSKNDKGRLEEERC